MTNLKTEAALLVKCEYADHFGYTKAPSNEIIGWFVSWQPDPYKTEQVNPYADTLTGRQQLDALEDWLFRNHHRLWEKSSNKWGERSHAIKSHQWRLDRIKWCCEQMGDNE